jgi:hypothetical protein
MSKVSTQNHEDSFSDNDDLGDNNIQVNDFNIKKFVLPAIDEKLSSSAQYHAFPKYKFGEDKKNMDNVILVTDDIKLNKGGIPRLDAKYRRNDSKREYFYLGWDEEQENCNALFKVLQSIDEEFDSKISYDSKKEKDPNLESKTVYIQKDKKKEPLNILEYVPMVRLSQGPPEGAVQEGQSEYVPYKRIKVKFSTEYNKDKDENEPNKLTTALFLGDKEEPEDVTYPTDYEKYFKYGCTARFVLQINKFWAKKAIENKKGVQQPRECGFNIKVLQIVITKESTVGGGQSIQEKYRKRCVALKPAGGFKQETKSVKETTETKNTKDTKNTKESSGESSDSSSESDDDKDDKKTKQTVKTTEKETKQSVKPTQSTQSSKKKVESSDESDSDDSTSSESDSDSDSDSDKKPAAKKQEVKKSR